MQFYNVQIPLEEQPSLILSAETEELGINAGLQDRVIQVYEGCVYMDFDKVIMESKNRGEYERLNPGNLPKVYIAYKTELSKVSGKVFNDVRSRFESGDPVVVKTMSQIADCAREGREALINQEFDRFNQLINENFDLRKQIMNISESNLELVDTARSCGATAKFSGSGGAIIGTYSDDEMLTRLIIDMKKIKARVIKPYIA